MRLIVITDQAGAIVGTARHAEPTDVTSGTGGPVPGPGQTRHVVDLPDDGGDAADPQDLHRRVAEYLAAH